MTNLLLAPPPLGTVLSLTGLPGGSNKAHDRSPYGNTGTIIGATWVRLPSGLWVLSFDGGDDYVNCGNSASLDASSEITIMAWIRPGVDFTNTTYQILDKRNGGIAPTLLWHITRHLVIYAGDYAAQGVTTSLTAGVWYHVVGVVVDGTTNGKVFINGVDDTTSTVIATFVTNTANLTIGKVTTGATNWFNGSIALVRMFNRALSALEIQNHFNREKHLFGVW